MPIVVLILLCILGSNSLVLSANKECFRLEKLAKMLQTVRTTPNSALSPVLIQHNWEEQLNKLSCNLVDEHCFHLVQASHCLNENCQCEINFTFFKQNHDWGLRSLELVYPVADFETGVHIANKMTEALTPVSLVTETQFQSSDDGKKVLERLYGWHAPQEESSESFYSVKWKVPVQMNILYSEDLRSWIVVLHANLSEK